ncbi:MAG: pantoate--beta-alanine ligase [Mariniblastus sp.]|nr:pantoate--beta-alanine ligase [Mariniblastus sp.]
MSELRVVSSCRELVSVIADYRKQGRSIGLVPTMGALHAGHLSLVERSLAATDLTFVSIFVNPTQFAADEDLDQYPRPLEQDLEKLSRAGADCVFLPDVSEMYPGNCTTSIEPPQVSRRWEGESRPSHFGGVCTVVLKLLNLIPADVAFFGEKDFQQLAVIRQMVEDLNVATRIEGCPIVREPDGLAMSSRNVYLSETDREIALSLHRTLASVAEQVAQGETDSHLLMAEMRQKLIDSGVSRVDYAVIADPTTLEVVEEVEGTVVALLACQVGQVRLIDNCVIAR